SDANVTRWTDDIILSDHKLVLACFCLAAAIVLVFVGLVIFASFSGKRRKKAKKSRAKKA
ncbi:MAG: hypothetical protein IKN57_02550, partial [Parasporobacterium sp.]|nr:hypothetical protein [Parasporobacterium sp.]